MGEDVDNKRALVKLTIGSGIALGSLVIGSGLTGVGAIVITGLLANVAVGIATNAIEVLTGVKDSDQGLDQGLTKAVGKAIARVIKTASEQYQDDTGKNLKKIAEYAEKNWVKIAQQELANKRYAELLNEDNLDQFLTPEEYQLTQEGNLSVEDWKNIFNQLCELHQSSCPGQTPDFYDMSGGIITYSIPNQVDSDFQLPSNIVSDVANLLHKEFPKTLRETFKEDKEDFDNDGKAFAGLILQLLTGMKEEIGKQRNQQTAEFAKILQRINKLEPQLKVTPEQIQQFLTKLSKDIEVNFPEIREQLGRMEDKQNEDSEISKEILENTECLPTIEDKQDKILEISEEILAISKERLEIEKAKVIPPINEGNEIILNPTNPSSEHESSYISREDIENLCFQEIEDGRQMIIRIKAPDNMGKNTLVKRIEEYASEKQYLIVRLDFWLPMEEIFKDYSKFLQWCSKQVINQLKLTNINANDYWNSNKDALDDNSIFDMFLDTNVFENNINKKILVVILSSLDQVFTLNFAPDFLKLLRSWHEAKRWENLRLVLSHSTECYLKLDLPSASSPFNVGLRIEVDEFTKEQIEDLAEKRQINLDDEQINQIMLELGGHPYLIDRIFSDLKAKNNNQIFQEILSFKSLKTVFKQELLELYNKLKDKSELLKVVINLLEQEPLETQTEDEKILFMLESIGLIFKKNEDNDTIIFRNNLYRQYFRQKLLKTK